MNAVAEQKRTDIRSEASFEVEYQFLTPEEYDQKKCSVESIVSFDQKALKIEALDPDNRSNNGTADPWLIDILRQMDDKLNLVLSLLSEEETPRHRLTKGTGQNISGSGMKMTTNQPAELGQIIHIDFVLSRSPYTRINLFGKVIRSGQLKGDGAPSYELAIQFLEPDEDAIDQIITRVFQLHRKAIRNSKRGT